MKLKIALISCISILTSYISYSQEIQKDSIYIKFIKNNGKYPNYRGLKFKNKNGLNFNLSNHEGVINLKSFRKDTLCNKHLKKYKFTDINDIDSLMNDWHKRNKSLLIKKYGISYPSTTNKNNIFTTHIIEEHKAYFVIYKVLWKNQGI